MSNIYYICLEVFSTVLTLSEIVVTLYCQIILDIFHKSHGTQTINLNHFGDLTFPVLA